MKRWPTLVTVYKWCAGIKNRFMEDSYYRKLKKNPHVFFHASDNCWWKYKKEQLKDKWWSAVKSFETKDQVPHAGQKRKAEGMVMKTSPIASFIMYIYG